jgi:putative flippase GtrA
MKRLLIFVVLGLFFAAPGEVLNQILARHNVRAFGSTMISYTVLLVIGFFAGKGFDAIFTKSRARLIYYLLFGLLGLMVEWFLLGTRSSARHSSRAFHLWFALVAPEDC